MSTKKIKICFAASSGGHYEQLLMLKSLIKKYDSFIVTEKTKYISGEKKTKSYYLLQVNRKEKSFVFKMLVNLILSFVIFMKERPNVIICTGVLAMIPLCLICKIYKGKLIYIESFAKVTSPTLTGKFLYKFADQFYIQWPQMKKNYPNAIYLGGVY